MNANNYPQWERPRRAILSILFYVIAGLIVLAGLIFTVVVLATSGDLVTYSREPSRWNFTIGTMLLNAGLLALLFWAAGAVISYLHGIRDNTRSIAQRLADTPKRNGPSEN
jgi:hypothetical protein